MAERTPVLDAGGVVAGYGGRPVIDSVDLAVGRGDIVGLLGANGSGKSTLIRALTGQLRLAAGRVAIDGVDLAAEPLRAKTRFGLAIDAPDLPNALSGRQYLDLVADIRGAPRHQWPCGDVCERLTLSAWLDRPIVEYSLGTRAKISIAAALLGAPPLLIFDESLNGLDPVAAFEFKAIVAELAATGDHGMIVATHVVDAVPAFCTAAVLLAEGQIADAWGADRLERARGAPGAFEREVIAALKSRQPALAG